MAPVQYEPAGTTTRPPPDLLHAAIASRKASVQSLAPSPTAPYFEIIKSRRGKLGGLIRFKISGTRCQTPAPGDCAKAGAKKTSGTWSSSTVGSTNVAAPPRPMALLNYLRLLMLT